MLPSHASEHHLSGGGQMGGARDSTLAPDDDAHQHTCAPFRRERGPALASAAGSQHDSGMAGETGVEVDGRRLRMTNLDKVLYPQTGTTKADVARYYSEVAHVLLPHSAGRAVTRKRWVDGVGTARRPKDAFFSKALDAGTPSWVARADIAHTDRIGTYPIIDSP